MNLLSVKNISKKYGFDDSLVYALDGVSFNLSQGEFVVIVGQSGCGKSTMLNMIGGIDKPDSGIVCFQGNDINKFSNKEVLDYRVKDLGYIFQSYNLIKNLTVHENIELATEMLDFDVDIEHALKDVGLEKYKDHLPSELSGGQQQRVAIARAIIKKPKLLLCDEPTGALDSKSSIQVLKLLRELTGKGITVVMVTHNLDYCEISDRVISMSDGKIVSDKVNDSVKAIDSLV